MDARKRHRRIWFSHALLPEGWAGNVLVKVDATGTIQHVEPDQGHRRGDAVIIGRAVPGMPNVHSHAHQRMMAGLAERAGPGADSFWTWRETMYDFVGRMDPDALETVATQLYREMLEAGFTSVGEFQYLHHRTNGKPYAEPAEMTLRCLAAAETAGIGMTALPVLYAHGDFGAQPPSPGQRRFLNDADDYLRIVETVRTHTADGVDAAVGIAPHSLRAVDEDLLRTVLKGAASIDPAMPIHLHIAEQRKEVDDCVQWSGQRPVAWLLDRFDVDGRWCAIHATHLDDDEIRALASSRAVVGLCPTTEANLGDGIFPADRFLAADGAIAIGSDSHVRIDPAEELRTLEYGQRLRDRSRNVLADGPGRSTGRSLFDRVVTGGARVLGRPIGALAPGYRADVAVLDLTHPLLLGRRDDAVLDAWIFAGDPSMVRYVFVGGRKVVDEFEHVDGGEIYRRFRDIAYRLSRRTR